MFKIESLKVYLHQVRLGMVGSQNTDNLKSLMLGVAYRGEREVSELTGTVKSEICYKHSFTCIC